MDQTRRVIALLFLLICAKGQETRNQNQEHEISALHPSMAVVLVVLSIMFCLTFLILAYAKFCHRVESRPSGLHNPNGTVGIGSRPRLSGVDKTIIESLPFFTFSSLKGSKEGLECAVCLSRFEDNELLRLLPKCRHAFHMSCIDTWLESHSSCPLCRYRFEAADIKSLRHSSSLRFSTGSSRDRDETGLEFFIQREGRPSSRFNLGNTLQKLARGRRDEPLIQTLKNQTSTNGTEVPLHHNVKHRIIVSDVMLKSRWSDVTSSDMMSLNSDMLNAAAARKGFGPPPSGGFDDDVAVKEQILKIKEDMERKRLFESKIVARSHETSSSSEATSSCPNIELESSMMSKSLDKAQQRSMSEITNVSRFKEVGSSSSRISSAVESEKDEKVRRLWLTIARRTIQLFSAQEKSSDAKQHTLNV